MEEKKKRKKKKGKKLLLFLVIAAAAGGAGTYVYRQRAASAVSADTSDVQTATATVMDITSELTASSSLSPKDTYNITSLVEGEILEANFEVGDVVEKDQVLYVIDASSMNTDLSSAETSLTRAKEKLTTAQQDYQEAAAELSGNTYKAKTSGYIKTLSIKEGDKVGNGTQLAEIYDDSTMKLTVPFLTGEAEQIQAGDQAEITLEDTGEVVEGTVTVVSEREETLTGGRLVKAVTMEVKNPGGLTTLTKARAQVDGFSSSEEGTFAAKTEATISADLSGNGNLEVGTLLVNEGSYIEAGTPLFVATAESAADYLKNFEDEVETASDNLQNAENQLSNTQDGIEDYTIKAPISGTVIAKNSKVGDNITRNSSSTTTMAVIYDLSSMTFNMSVDELDVRSVKEGQTVQVTADAVEGETFTGTVTNVSMESSYSNGVTNYPVTVTMTETGDLLPGMNVDATVILDSAENALCIPAGALLRGDRVYVKEGSPSLSGSAAADGTEAASPKASDGAGTDSAGGEVPSGAPDGDGAPAAGEMPSAGDGAPAGGDSAAGQDNGPAIPGGAPDGDGVPAGGEMPSAAGDGAPAAGDGAANMPGAAGVLNNGGAPDGFVAVRVTTGIINDDYVQILSGLSEGDVVYVDPNAGNTTTNMWQMGGPGGMGGGPGGGGPGGGGPGGGGGGMGGRP